MFKKVLKYLKNIAVVMYLGWCVMPDAHAGSYFGAPTAEIKFLNAEEAFNPEMILEQNQLKIIWVLEPGYYLYHKSFDFELLDSKQAVIKKLSRIDYFPAGLERHDEYMGDVITYSDYLENLIVLESEDIEKSRYVRIHYQGCAEAGLCYPPSVRVLPFKQ